MRLTRRGTVVAVAVFAAVLQGYFFGERTLNYVAVPAVVALVIGAFVLWRGETAIVERSTLAPGSPGETRTETIALGGRGIATVSETLPDGIGGESIERTVSLPARIERELSFRERGRYTLGPVTVRRRDPLGLLAATDEIAARRDVTVYPAVYELDRTRVFQSLSSVERNADDWASGWLREYEKGDPIRLIHWKATAKHDELLVTHTGTIQHDDRVELAIVGRSARMDELATAAASLAVSLLEAGIEVSLTLPGEDASDGRDRRRREDILSALATLDESAWDDATDPPDTEHTRHDRIDLFVPSGSETVMIRVGETVLEFDEIRSNDRLSAPATAAAEPAVGGR